MRRRARPGTGATCQRFIGQMVTLFAANGFVLVDPFMALPDGYWRHAAQDCKRWEFFAKVEGHNLGVHVDGWETIGQSLKGLELIEDERLYWHWEAFANHDIRGFSFRTPPNAHHRGTPAPTPAPE